MGYAFFVLVQLVLLIVAAVSGLVAMLGISALGSATVMQETAIGVYLLLFVVSLAAVAVIEALAQVLKRLEKLPDQPGG